MEEELLHTSSAPIFISGDLIFEVATQGMPLDCLALAARGASNTESHGIITIGEKVFGRLPLSGH